MGEQGVLDPTLLGFETDEPPRRMKRGGGCFVRLSQSGGRSRCAVHLDPRLTETAWGMSEDERIDVAMDDDGRLMFRRGNGWKLGQRSKRHGCSTVLMDGRAERMLRIHGGGGDYVYRLVWRNDDFFVIAPREEM